MKRLFSALFIVSALSIYNTSVNSNEIEEVIVVSSYTDQTLGELENPLHVLKGDDVLMDSTLSLGETISSLLGVSSSDFGSAVGQPIIRGMSGSRVKIMNNSKSLRDISSLGADHMNEVDLNDIQQIEVVRGPSSLLYSSGTIGGIINIIDNTIARKDFKDSKLSIGLESQSVNDGDSHDFSYQNNIGGFNLSLAYKDSEFDNFDIPSGAVLHTEEEHHDEEEHEDEEEHHGEEEHEGEHEEDLGYLPNSDFKSTSKRIGLSKAGDWGYFGFSYKNSESLFGIPFHGEGHEDHDEHEGEDHYDEEAHHDEDELHEEGEHEGERIFSNTESDIFDVEGSYIVNNSWLRKVNYFFRSSEYLHTEQHAEEEGEDEHMGHDDHEEGPTNFENESKEFGAIFDLSNDLFSQKVSLSYVEEEISIIGAEAFMRPTDNEELSIGYYLSKEFLMLDMDFGIRYDKITRNGSLAHHEEEHHDDEGEEGHDDDEHEKEEHEEEIDFFNKDFSKTSFAINFGRQINDNLNISLGLSRVERAPSSVELFMNGPHLSTGRFEVGNTNLKSETANNIDLNLYYQNNNFSLKGNLFSNEVDNYIYLQDETEEDHEDEEHGDHEGLILSNYLQNDAKLEGYEFEISQAFSFDRGSLTLSLGRDSVSGEFKNGKNIPRIVPARNILSLSYSENNLEANLTYKDVEEQNDIGDGESMTEDFEMLNFVLRKTFTLNNESKMNLSIFGKNLLDEVARNHSSFVKNQVPLPGRNYGVKLKVIF
ncbi:TonB-dependent receptor [Hyphomicrobiales bacterium]|nr:TonB-dependent receptor [Hyphomicrobiales bacterium]